MKTTITLLASFLTFGTAAHAQVEPAATANMATAEFGYAARYSQVVQFYGNGLGTAQEGIISGDVNYRNGNHHLPFGLSFSGGYDIHIAGPSYSSGPFESFLVSQGLLRRSWKLRVTDTVSYRKSAPITGASGVPGTGEPIGEPPPPGQTILTLNTRTVTNMLRGAFDRTINHATALSVGGGSELLFFPDGNGLDTHALMGNARLTRRLNARSSLLGQYLFYDYSYSGSTLTPAISSFVSNTALFGYQRQLNRQISIGVSGGPQWVESSNNSVVPSSTRFSASANFFDRSRFGLAGLNYNHGASGGAGFQTGSEVDSVSGQFSRAFGRRLHFGLTGGYARNAELNDAGVIHSMFGAAMGSMRLSPTLALFASYTATDQSSNTALPANALTHLVQGISFGISYSPREKRVIRQ